MLNREVQTAFPGEKFDRKGLALFHLTAHLVLADNTDPKADLVRALRRISSELEGPGLEQLLGYLVAHGPPDASSVMSRSERVGLRTHNPPWWVLYCFYHFGRETGLKILSPPPRPRYVRVNPLRNRGRVGLPLELRKYSGQLVETDSGIHILDTDRVTLDPSEILRDGGLPDAGLSLLPSSQGGQSCSRRGCLRPLRRPLW